ncbi:MAG: hypothetical protein ABGY09_04065 [Euryarchaeota archaeon]
MEPLTLALLILPGDPGDFTEPVLEHPEVLLAKGRAVGKVVKKLLRALGRRRLSELYPEWWGVWRYAPIISHRKVRLYCQTVYPTLLATLAALFSSGLIPLLLCRLGVVGEAWGYVSGTSLIAAVLGVLPELMMAGEAVRDYLSVAFKGGDMGDRIFAFKMWGVYGLLLMLSVYVAAVIMAYRETRDYFRGFPLTVRISWLVTLAIPLTTGLWTLWWGLWVVS